MPQVSKDFAQTLQKTLMESKNPQSLHEDEKIVAFLDEEFGEEIEEMLNEGYDEDEIVSLVENAILESEEELLSEDETLEDIIDEMVAEGYSVKDISEVIAEDENLDDKEKLSLIEYAESK